MHELSLCEGIVRIIVRKATEDGFSRVVKIHLTVGTLSCVSPDSLLFCFPSVSRGTVAEGADLVFSTTEDDALRVANLEVC